MAGKVFRPAMASAAPPQRHPPSLPPRASPKKRRMLPYSRSSQAGDEVQIHCRKDCRHQQHQGRPRRVNCFRVVNTNDMCARHVKLGPAVRARSLARAAREGGANSWPVFERALARASCRTACGWLSRWGILRVPQISFFLVGLVGSETPLRCLCNGLQWLLGQRIAPCPTCTTLCTTI